MSSFDTRSAKEILPLLWHLKNWWRNEAFSFMKYIFSTATDIAVWHSLKKKLLRERQCLGHRFQNCEARPSGGALLVLWGGGGRSLYETFLTKYGRKIKYILGTVLGWNMKVALFYNLHFTKVHIKLEKVCYSLAELYVKSVYLNLFGWRRCEVH
jgi:hypothetical protein